MNKDLFLDRLWRSRAARSLLAGGTAAGLAIAAAGCGSGPARSTGATSANRGGATPVAAGRTPGQQAPAAATQSPEGNALAAPRTTSELCTVGLEVVRQAFKDPSATCSEQTDPSSGEQVYTYTLADGTVSVSETSGVSYAYLASQPGMTAGPKVAGHDTCVGNASGTGGEQAMVNMGGDQGAIVTLQPQGFNGVPLSVLGAELMAATPLAEAF